MASHQVRKVTRRQAGERCSGVGRGSARGAGRLRIGPRPSSTTMRLDGRVCGGGVVSTTGGISGLFADQTGAAFASAELVSRWLVGDDGSRRVRQRPASLLWRW